MLGIDNILAMLVMLLGDKVESSFTADSQQRPETNKMCCATHPGFQVVVLLHLFRCLSIRKLLYLKP